MLLQILANIDLRIHGPVSCPADVCYGAAGERKQQNHGPRLIFRDRLLHGVRCRCEMPSAMDKPIAAKLPARLIPSVVPFAAHAARAVKVGANTAAISSTLRIIAPPLPMKIAMMMPGKRNFPIGVVWTTRVRIGPSCISMT